MAEQTLELPAALIDTAWLARHLGDPRLRVLESTVYLTHDQSGQRRTVSGRSDWAEAHIPGSAFADLIDDLSDPANTRYSFPFPPAERFAAAMSRLGVGDDSTVVVYDRAGNSWAARLWWLLRAYGFDRAAVLNGGWNRWTAEGRPVSSEPPRYPPAHFTPRPRPDLIADKAEVLEAIGDERRLLINALSPDDFYGRLASPSRRPGHIPGSVNIPSAGPGGIVDPDTALYLPLDELRRRFEAESATERERVITYCGGVSRPAAPLWRCTSSACPTLPSTTAPSPSGPPTPSCRWRRSRAYEAPSPPNPFSNGAPAGEKGNRGRRRSCRSFLVTPLPRWGEGPGVRVAPSLTSLLLGVRLAAKPRRRAPHVRGAPRR